MKSVHIRSFFWFVFSLIRAEYGEILRIHSECGKLRTRKNSVFGHSSRSGSGKCFFSKIWASLIYFAVLYPAIFCWNETVVQLGSLWGDRVGWDAVSPPQWSPGAKSRKSLAILHSA